MALPLILTLNLLLASASGPDPNVDLKSSRLCIQVVAQALAASTHPSIHLTLITMWTRCQEGCACR